LTGRLLDAGDPLTRIGRNVVRLLLELSAIAFEGTGDLGDPIVL
jgi:hypothetical protein